MRKVVDMKVEEGMTMEDRKMVEGKGMVGREMDVVKKDRGMKQGKVVVGNVIEDYKEVQSVMVQVQGRKAQNIEGRREYVCVHMEHGLSYATAIYEKRNSN